MNTVNLSKMEVAAIEALKAISLLAGNLPDDRLTTRTGGNDAVARGEMVVCARKIAQEFLQEYDPKDAIVMTPMTIIPANPKFAPRTDIEYEYMGQAVKITRINPYPSTDSNGVQTPKYEVTIETRLGDMATVEFDELGEW